MVVVLPPPNTPLVGQVGQWMSFTWYSFFQHKFRLPIEANPPVKFANITKNPVEGLLIPVTDSTTNTWGAIITGGGALHVLAYYNGTNWTVAAA